MKQYTICFDVSAAITVDAESEEEALEKFRFDDAVIEDAHRELGYHGLYVTEIYEEG